MIFNLVKKWTEGILPHEDVLKIPEKENKVKVLVAQSRLTLRDSMDCNHSGSSVQAKTLAAAAAAAVAAAKSLQSCLTLCDPIDGSPPGSPRS